MSQINLAFKPSVILFSLILPGFLFIPPAAAHEYMRSVSNSIITVEKRRVNYYLSIPATLFSSPNMLLGQNENDFPEDFLLATGDHLG